MSKGTNWKRLLVLAGAGAVTFGVVFRAVDGPDEAVVEPVAHAPRNAGASDPGHSARPAEAPVEAPDVPTRARLAQNTRTDPFAPKGWTPPPPPPPKPAPPEPPPPPPPPTAPPIPYKFIGQFDDKSTKPAAFITKGDALFVVHVGDVVESTYRVESFNAAQVVVTYLPLKQRQTIDVSGG